MSECEEEKDTERCKIRRRPRVENRERAKEVLLSPNDVSRMYLGYYNFCYFNNPYLYIEAAFSPDFHRKWRRRPRFFVRVFLMS